MSGLKRASGDRNNCTGECIDLTEDKPMPMIKKQKRVIPVNEQLIQFYSKSEKKEYRILSNFSDHAIDVSICFATLGNNKWLLEIGQDTSSFSDGTIDMPMANDTIESFPTLEAAFQACKYLYVEHLEANFGVVKSQIVALSTLSDPVEAKKFGSKGIFKKLKLSLDLYKWNQVALRIMTALCMQKVKQHDDVRLLLASTRGKKLLHFSLSDNYWGGRISKENGELVGSNHLGNIFEVIRKDPDIMGDDVELE